MLLPFLLLSMHFPIAFILRIVEIPFIKLFLLFRCCGKRANRIRLPSLAIESLKFQTIILENLVYTYCKRSDVCIYGSDRKVPHLIFFFFASLETYIQLLYISLFVTVLHAATTD